MSRVPFPAPACHAHPSTSRRARVDTSRGLCTHSCNVLQIWDIQPVAGKADRFRIRLTDGATCAVGAAIGPAGKAITDGEVGDCDLIELDSGSVSSVAGKLMVNGVDGILRKQPPSHAQVLPLAELRSTRFPS